MLRKSRSKQVNFVLEVPKKFIQCVPKTLIMVVCDGIYCSLVTLLNRQAHLDEFDVLSNSCFSCHVW